MAKKITSSLNFSQALVRLEEIVSKLEEPDLDLEDSLKLLEEGVKLHKICKSKLTEANARITTILGKDSISNDDKVQSESEVN